MSTSDWIALGAAVIAALSLGLSGWAIVYARSSARSNETMAQANREMADEATKSRELLVEQRQTDLDRLHRELGPVPPAAFEATLFRGTPADSLTASVTVPRGYRIKAEAVRAENNSASAGLGPVLHPNREEVFHFEQWPPGSDRPVTEMIQIRFWPPLEGDGVEVWECPCGRPTGESLDGPGHWVWRIPVVYEPPPKPATARVEPPSEESRRDFYRPNKRLDLG